MREYPQQRETAIRAMIDSMVSRESGKIVEITITYPPQANEKTPPQPLMTVHFKGKKWTREKEDQFYERLERQLIQWGYILTGESGPGGFEGQYGDPSYEQCDTFYLAPTQPREMVSEASNRRRRQAIEWLRSWVGERGKEDVVTVEPYRGPGWGVRPGEEEKEIELQVTVKVRGDEDRFRFEMRQIEEEARKMGFDLLSDYSLGVPESVGDQICVTYSFLPVLSAKVSRTRRRNY